MQLVSSLIRPTSSVYPGIKELRAASRLDHREAFLITQSGSRENGRDSGELCILLSIDNCSILSFV